MPAMQWKTGVVFVVASATAIGACSSAEEPAAEQCVSHTASATTTAGARAMSFEQDVLPIFGQSCTFASCHGAKSGDDHGIFLGTRGGTNEAARVRAELLDRAPSRVPSMRFVKPHDPANSYLMRKLEARFCDLPECAGGACGDRMPRGGEPLESAARAAVEAWIAQGAKP